MLSKVHAAPLRGVEAVPVEVEVSVGPGEQKVVVVGLPDAAVRESAGGAKDTRANHGGGQVEEKLGWFLPWRWISMVIIVSTLRGF